ncbi:uncharacterized protein KZ484_002648 isoform 2-T2 [Pholidichthys leucotaenia]
MIFSFMMVGHLLLIVLVFHFHKSQGQALSPPKLTVTSTFIKETDLITLTCQPPSGVLVNQCVFYSGQRHYGEGFSCTRTLTGTELLQMSKKTSPAKVHVRCYYTVLYGDQTNAFPWSDTSYITVQSLSPPKLTVNPSVITDTDSVTLTCQPPGVQLDQCFFYAGDQQNPKGSHCTQTLTGTELLQMSKKTSPAEVHVRCYYTALYGDENFSSPWSDMSYIIVQTVSPPKLTVNPSVITDTDSVTLTCQPPGVQLDQCFFYAGDQQNPKGFPCTQTLTGTELLQMSKKTSPAEVHVRCYYTALYGDEIFSSPWSDMSYITVQTVSPPKLTVNPSVITDTDSVTLICQPPGVQVDQCFFYARDQQNAKGFPCTQTLTGTELLQMSNMRSPANVEVGCYYTLYGSSYASPLSDISSVTVQNMEEESGKTSTRSATTTADLTTPADMLTPTTTRIPKDMEKESGKTSTRSATTTADLTTPADMLTPTTTRIPKDQPGSETPKKENKSGVMWMLIVAVTGCAVIVIIIFLKIELLRNKRRSETHPKNRKQAGATENLTHTENNGQGGLLPADDNEVYSMITLIPGADCPADSNTPQRRELKIEDSDIYHVYSTIPERPPTSTSQDMVYSLSQAH